MYKNTQYNRNRLQKIQQEFDHKYQDENGWDQIKLWQHYGRHVGDVNASDGKYIDDGSWGSFKADSTWYHCKGPGRKEKTDIDTWHNLDMTPQLT